MVMAMNVTLANGHAASARAMVGSIALHALLGGWLFSSVAPVEIMPQQMIQITMVAAPAEEERKPDPVPQVTKPRNIAQQSQDIPEQVMTKLEARRAVVKKEAVPPQYSPLADAAELAGLNPGAGSRAATGAMPMVTTKPLFDAAYLRNPAPEYPAHAKRRGMEGTVMLDVAVSSDGMAQYVRIAESSGFSVLDESAKDAVSRWKFVPARRGSEMVEARVLVPVEFRME